MAIVKMRKLDLIAMSYEKDALLNALQRTGAVEIVEHADTQNTVVPIADSEEMRSYLTSVETALSDIRAGIRKLAEKYGA